MSISRETVAPAMRAAAEDQVAHGADSEVDRLYSSDTRDLMGLFVMLRKLMVQCTITDFAFSDLYRPTHARLQKILSYVINFLRFRESQTRVIDAHFAESERTKLRVQQLFSEKERLEEKLEDLAAGHEEKIKDNERKDREILGLKAKLLELDKKKRQLIADGKRNDENKERLKQGFTERGAYLEQVADEASKLKPYTLQKPDALETNLRELGVSLANDRITLENLEKRARELSTSAETFQGGRLDVEGATKAMADLAQDIQREEAELRKASRNRDLLSDRSATVREIEHQEMILQKQLEATAKRTQELRADHKEREETSLSNVALLREQQASLARERSEKGREMERLKVRIDVKEKQVSIYRCMSTKLTECRCKISKKRLKRRLLLHESSIRNWRVMSTCTLVRWSSVLLE
jgi:kinetochore protein Nuf2